MRIPAESVALYHVESKRSEQKGAKAVSESAALGVGFPDALPRQRAARHSTPELEQGRRDRQGQQNGAQPQPQNQPQPDRRKEKQRVLIDTRIRRPLDLANGTVIDVKV